MKYAPAGTETDLHCTRDDLTIKQLTNIASLGPRRMSPKVNQQVPLENELMTENRKEGDRPKFHHWAAEPRREFIKFQGTGFVYGLLRCIFRESGKSGCQSRPGSDHY